MSRPLLFALLVACGNAACAGQASPASAPSSSTTDPAFEAKAVGPLTAQVSLQIVSVFSYEANE